MIEDLFKNNKLEHVQVTRGTNIIASITLSDNIENLMFFQCIDANSYKITLDMEKFYPENLIRYYKSICNNEE